MIGPDFTMRSDSRFFIEGSGGYRAPLRDLDYRDVDVLSSHGPLDFGSNQWVVIAEIDAEEAFASVAPLQRTITLWTVSIAAFVVALGLWIVIRVTQPVIALTEAAKQVGSGGEVKPLGQRSSDEIGDLTSQFNQMVYNLHQQQITIDRQPPENYQLLLKILPEPIANRLKNADAKIADAS